MTSSNINEQITEFINSAFQKYIVQDYNEAIRDLKAAEVLDKYNPEIIYNLGVNYCKLGLYKTSIEYFEKLLNLPHTFVEVINIRKILAYSLIKIEEYSKAEDFLNSILKDSPSDTHVKNMKGYCLEKQKKYFDAINEYKTIIEFDNKNYNAYNSLAYIIAKTDGDLNIALNNAQIALNASKENPAYLDTIGYINLKLKKLDLAEKHFKSALAKSPFSEEIKNHLSELKKLKDNSQ